MNKAELIINLEGIIRIISHSGNVKVIEPTFDMSEDDDGTENYRIGFELEIKRRNKDRLGN